MKEIYKSYKILHSYLRGIFGFTELNLNNFTIWQKGHNFVPW